VVVDEAQKFSNQEGENWFLSILSILNWPTTSQQHYKTTSLYIFCDQLQKIRHEYSGLSILDSNKDPDEMLPDIPTKCQLSIVIRNSTKIYEEWEKKLKIPVTDAELFPRKGLVFDSLRRFSGLEAPVVIAVFPKPNPIHENADKVNILLYSRAMVELHIILLT
jgi:hypothetical protein